MAKEVQKKIQTNKLPVARTTLNSLVEPPMNSLKEKTADTVGALACGLILGSFVDWYAGLDFVGIVASRSINGVVGAVIASPYGMWRNFVFKKLKAGDCDFKWKDVFRDYSTFKKMIKWSVTDFIAFNTFQTPFYATCVGVASYISYGHTDLEKVRSGAMSLAVLTPAIGPIMGFSMDLSRRMFGIKSAAQQAKNS